MISNQPRPQPAQSEPIDRYPHIKRFVDRVRGTDLTSNKPVVFTAQDVKDLSADITKLLLDLSNAKSSATSAEINLDNLQISGGSFK